MFARMIWSVLFIFVLAGCATGSKKQATQSQPMVSEKSQKAYQQESYSMDYDNNDTWSTDSYEKSAKQSYPKTSVELSPKQVRGH